MNMKEIGPKGGASSTPLGSAKDKVFFLKEVITVLVIVLLVERRSKIENFLKTKINVNSMPSKLDLHFLHWNQMNPNQHSFAREN